MAQKKKTAKRPYAKYGKVPYRYSWQKGPADADTKKSVGKKARAS
jgi:hypothetical protein